MINRTSKSVKNFLRDAKSLFRLPVSEKYAGLILEDHPFDEQLLNLSHLYRVSRRAYLAINGTYQKKLCSTMRSLSSHDLFTSEIEYTPALSELRWFTDYSDKIADSADQVAALKRFNDIALFHEQNHRIVWQMLPPAPVKKDGLRRYLNFAESLVVTLDAALGDEVGKKLSVVFERMNVLYRPGGESRFCKSPKAQYRRYLISFFCATYFLLERLHKRDILKAVNYLFPDDLRLNRDAVKRALELNESFVTVTNPQWQELYWKSAAKKLQKIHDHKQTAALNLPPDPLDLGAEISFMHQLLDYFEGDGAEAIRCQ